MTAQPGIVCTLGIAAQGQRKLELERGLAQRVEEVVRLADGYALRFGPGGEIRAEVDELIEFESRCCAFLTFEVRTAGADGLWLELRGPAGSVEFLRDWIESIELGSAAESTVRGRPNCGC